MKKIILHLINAWISISMILLVLLTLLRSAEYNNMVLIFTNLHGEYLIEVIIVMNYLIFEIVYCIYFTTIEVIKYGRHR